MRACFRVSLRRAGLSSDRIGGLKPSIRRFPHRGAQLPPAASCPIIPNAGALAFPEPSSAFYIHSTTSIPLHPFPSLRTACRSCCSTTQSTFGLSFWKAPEPSSPGGRRPGSCRCWTVRRESFCSDAPKPRPAPSLPRPPCPAGGTLTEHGHELLGVEVPVAPVGPVAVQRGVLLMVVRGFRPEGVDDPDSAPAPGHRESESATSGVSLGWGHP